LIHRAGLGVSQAIGVGGRDLWDEVGGLSTLQALEALEEDVGTEVIVLVSKPPSERTAKTVLCRAAMCSKPVVVQFLGQALQQSTDANVRFADTLEEAAQMAVALAGGGSAKSGPFGEEDGAPRLAAGEVAQLAPGQRYVRGLFSGGTLCGEAMWILKDDVEDVRSNAPLDGRPALVDPRFSQGHSLIDMGTSDFTRGRPHPMIDLGQRQARIAQEAADPCVAVLLLDVVLGFGCHLDPAGALAGSIMKARETAGEEGRYLSVVASVCGTEDDIQSLDSQEGQLRDVGAIVVSSNAQASRLTGAIARRISSGLAD
jgi:FdrA protein